MIIVLLYIVISTFFRCYVDENNLIAFVFYIKGFYKKECRMYKYFIKPRPLIKNGYR